MSKKKNWPQNCQWPEPKEDGAFWEAEDAESLPVDETAQDLLDIKEYMDELVSEGVLLYDYSLNHEYDAEDADDEWEPECGLDYWSDGFDIESWSDDLAAHINLLKLPLPSPVDEIQHIIGYEFVNENLIRQAFTRRAFGIEHGIGDSENLEFFGDTVLNTVVTREIARHLTEVDVNNPSSSFSSTYSEGELTKLRTRYICKEYLSARTVALGLDRYI